VLPNALSACLAAATLAFAGCGGGGDDHRPAATIADRPAPVQIGPLEGPPDKPAHTGSAALGDEVAAAGAPLPASAELERASKQVFDDYYERSGDDDPRYYADGVWHGPTICWPCATGPAGLGAVLWRLGDLPDRRQRAAVIETFDHAITEHQQPDGSYGKETNSEAINVAFFAPVLGSALLVLGDRIPRRTRKRWQRSLLRSTEFLERHKELDWYVNGNINLAYALTLYVTWRATGDQHARTLYRRQLEFVTSPPARWADRGLELKRRPSRKDGSDGRAFLAESGPGGTGYDPEYSLLQLDVLSRLYLLSGDREIRRLMNLLTNQTLTGVDERWRLLTTGTRHPERDRYVPYNTAALVVLARLGGRKDLRSKVQASLEHIADSYRSATTFTHQNFYRGADSQLGTALLALNMRRPADPRYVVRRHR
jgi:hypothetical protein